VGFNLAAPNLSHAAADRIVAVVNDQVITLTQLQARTNLNLRQLDLANPTPAQQQAVTKRTLASMIDEELQRQYALTNRLEPGNNEIKAAEASVIQGAGGPEAWRKITAGNAQAAREKIIGEIRWQKIVARDLEPRLSISTAEVDRLIAELGKSRQIEERNLSMILLGASATANEQEQLAKLQELRSKATSAAAFAEMAKAYSEDKSAVNGGLLGWFANGELNPQLEEALNQLTPGSISQPIRTPMGWHLLRLNEVRTSQSINNQPIQQANLYLLAAPLPNNPASTTLLTKALASTTKKLTNTTQVQAYFAGAEISPTFPASGILGWINLTDLEGPVQQVITDLKPGQWSPDLNAGNRLGRIYVADVRQVMPPKLLEYRKRVTENLSANRLELAARRLMQELRQKAFVDIRY
jgi:peptidyl-prolyl cis-trans isomerase SurA